MALTKIKCGVYGFPDWHITEWSDFLDWLQRLSHEPSLAIFRGQRCRWSVLPSIARVQNDSGIIQSERRSFERFRAEAPRTLQKPPSSDWDWLVVAQHHGLPTRLLDWSEDPFVALWFALRNADQPGSEPEVWVMNPAQRDIIEDLEAQQPFSGTRTKAFRASFHHPRILAQKSWFTATKFSDERGMAFIPIEKNHRLRTRVQRLKIPHFAIPELLDNLTAQGYGADQLIPDTQTVALMIRGSIFPNV